MSNNVLAKAYEKVSDNKENYGSPDKCLQKIADRWSIIFGKNISRKDVILAMIDLKIVRASANQNCEDSFVDIAGYASLFDFIS